MRFSADMIAVLRQADRQFDSAQHCLQVAYDASRVDPSSPNYINIPSYGWLELSASGPCPSGEALAPANTVVARFWFTDDRVGIKLVDDADNAPPVGEYTHELLAASRAPEVGRLCFGESRYGFGAFSRRCNVVLRGGRICEVVPAGRAPRRARCQ